jgi:hypothetical protein
MSNEQIQAICTAIGSFAWNNDFEQFCKVCDFNPEHSYSMEKWREFVALNRSLSKFDSETISKIVRAGLAKSSASIQT